jgi:hypothetical protein
MHTRAKAHVRAAEKYMYDKNDRNTRKAIAHFGRAMHYFGANCLATGVAKETDEILGFIVTFRDFHDKYTRAAYFLDELHVRERSTRGIALSPDEFVNPKSPHALWGASGRYAGLLRDYHREDTSPYEFLELKGDKFKGCRISYTLYITKNVTDSVAFLIPGSAERGQMFFSLCGISDGNDEYKKYSYSLDRFLNYTDENSYKVKREPYESIEFQKHRGEWDSTVDPVPLCTITALLVLPEADAIAKVELAVRAIEGTSAQFETAVAYYYNNDCHDGTFGDRDARRKLFNDKCENGKKATQATYADTLSCWLEFAFFSGEITHAEYEVFKKDVEVTRAKGMSPRDINAKYIMIVLRRALPRGNQKFREERVRVNCIAKRSFSHTDLWHIDDKKAVLPKSVS